MPITPFHFGVGAALHAAAPARVSFLAFCAANVLIDLEPGYFMLAGEYPLHRFLHTPIGATLAAAATCALFAGARRLAATRRWPDPFAWQRLRLPAVAAGAFLGAWSHVLLDAVMHADVRPLAPFSDANPLWHAMPVRGLHVACVAAGLAGIAAVAIRSRLRTSRGRQTP